MRSTALVVIATAVVVLVPGEPQALASTDGAFSNAGIGAMTAERVWPASAPLPDGDVLVAGGFDETGTNSLDTAEIYDPTTDEFSSTGPLAYHVGSAVAA